MSTKKIFIALAAVFTLGLTVTSCSPNSVADEDSLYINPTGIDRSQIKVPTNG
ncbi:hypothetical protein [Robertkochia aurantiaca]|uniref:hypothetical protein n=1 Tax=Robertkochia aurantiaca TaxID=2873700 RepID=UPI001CCB9F24|nr:hypothetical protein [Robertkochia sp. 3YJGBD-33]